MSRKTEELKQKILNLEIQIKKAENHKDAIIKTIHILLDKYKNREINHEEYHEELNKTFQDKSAENWINYYENYINISRAHIKNYKKKIAKSNTIRVLIPLILIIIIPLVYFIFPLKQVLLGPPIQIISPTDVWKYEDTDTNLPDTWITQTYDDFSWSQGPGKLGFGTNDGAFGTTVQDLNQITYYYRKNFNIDEVSLVNALSLTIDYDDCYAIYINGNLLNSAPNFVNNGHSTACSSVHNSAEDGSGPTAPISPTIQFTPQQIAWLENGPNNLIAVEIHQQSTTSSDTVFSLSMDATLIDTQPPTITINSPIDSSTIQDPTPLADITTDEISTITYQIDSGPIQNACSSCTSANFFLNLPEGTHILTVFAEDVDLNIGTQQSTFTIDFQSQFFDTYNDDSSITNLNSLMFSPGSVSLSSTPSQNTLIFQGSSNIDETEISLNNPNTNYGSAISINIDGQNPHAHAVMKFPNLIGYGPNQVPPGSTIISASLEMFCTNLGNNQLVYLISEGWNEAQATWNQRLTGIPWSIAGVNGVPSRDESILKTFICNRNNQLFTNDITQFVQRWSDGTPNNGFVMTDTGSNGIDYDSSESTNSPVLTVIYQSPSSNSGSFESTLIDAITPITSIDSISWTETGTDVNNQINLEVYDGSSWTPVSNGGSIVNFNSNILAYRATFNILDSPIISLEDITISWTQLPKDTTPPSITIDSIGGDMSSLYSISDNTPEIILTTDEIGDCRASLLDESYDNMVDDVDCTGDGTMSHTCQFSTPISDNTNQEIHFSCQDTLGNKNSILDNSDNSFELDTLTPIQSNWNPAKSSTISTTSTTITLETNEIGDCRASLLDESYDNMVDDVDCTGDGTTAHSCPISGLSLGPEIVYISCSDDTEVFPNKDSITTNEHLDYLIGNNPPTIVSMDITPIEPLTLLAGTTTDATFTFIAEDVDGASDLDDATATASFSKSGEATRNDIDGCTFVPGSEVGNQRTYTCTITMQYFDDNGIWDISVSIQDFASTLGSGASTFTINLLQDITITPTTINFPTVNLGGVNILSSTATRVTNLGNFDTATDGPVTITAADLIGETTPSDLIPAANFKVSGSAGSLTVCTSGGISLADGIPVSIINLNLPRGTSGSNTEDISYCLTLVPVGIRSQYYSATSLGGNPWTISLLIVPFAIRRKKKSKKQVLNEINKKLKISPISLRKLLKLEEKLRVKYDTNLTEVLKLVEETKTINEEKIKLPIQIFKQEIKPAEAVCKYLKENKNLKFFEIAKLLNRDQRTIWINYKNATKKKKEKIETNKESLEISIEIFSNRKLSLLESLVNYLKKDYKNSEIAKLLNKDPRNIYTLYTRATKKLNNNI